MPETTRLLSWSVRSADNVAAVVTKEPHTDIVEMTMGPRNREPMTLALYPHQARQLIHDLIDALGTDEFAGYPATVTP